MSARLTFVGLEGLRDALRRLPGDLKTEAASLIRESAAQAQRDIVAQYPRGRTGNLRSQVDVVSIPAPTYGAAAAVRSDANYARYVEDGTRYMRGVRVLVPTMIAARAALYRNLADVIHRAGFEVRRS